MIIDIVTCPVCLVNQRSASTFLTHLVEHIDPITPPDPDAIREQLNRQSPVGDIEVEDAMFHVEHLIANEWGPMTRGVRLDMPANNISADRFPEIAMGLLLAVMESLAPVVDEDPARQPDAIRYEVKASPLWKDPA